MATDSNKVLLRLHPLADRVFVGVEELTAYDQQFVLDAVTEAPVVLGHSREPAGFVVRCSPGTVDDAAAEMKRALTRDGFEVEVRS